MKVTERSLIAARLAFDELLYCAIRAKRSGNREAAEAAQKRARIAAKLSGQAARAWRAKRQARAAGYLVRFWAFVA